jgi:hypothetical protein
MSRRFDARVSPNQEISVGSPEQARPNCDDRRPDLMVRFGYGPEMPRSLRRPTKQVIA